MKNEIARITKPGGVVLSFGWNTNGIGKKRGFDQVEIMIVDHGGAHNATLCLAENKTKKTFGSKGLTSTFVPPNSTEAFPLCAYASYTGAQRESGVI